MNVEVSYLSQAVTVTADPVPSRMADSETLPATTTGTAAADGPVVTVGMRVPYATFYAGAAALRAVVKSAEDAGIDRLTMGDHVSFRDGTGFDGLLQMAALAAVSDRVQIETAVYLLPLRHPVPVARQVTQVAGLAPGRFVFGIGVGGDDPHEFETCGVPPSARGRRTDESLHILTRLLAGETVDHDGEFFTMRAAKIRPVPPVPVPVVVGGRALPAWRRTARFGHGWLALFVSPDRFREGVAAIGQLAVEYQRADQLTAHGVHIWCGVGSDQDRLAAAMEGLYGITFSRFERYAPYGSPRQVADFAARYVAAGARHINFAPVAASDAESVDFIAEVARLLRDL
jgi:alkanesulfonate monooxygenase SsuD/methylene tetrahydromethanopterin reductase-like flavin-dependent oxidoreductase (luciferase family)